MTRAATLPADLDGTVFRLPVGRTELAFHLDSSSRTYLEHGSEAGLEIGLMRKRPTSGAFSLFEGGLENVRSALKVSHAKRWPTVVVVDGVDGLEAFTVPIYRSGFPVLCER